jgi:acetyltransferase-like isoleucine patch superfamily enzyme
VRYEVIARHKPGGKLTLGDGASIGRRVSIDISGDVTIGARAVVSEEALILTHDHDPCDITRKHALPLLIGEGAWIGARAIILASCGYIGAGAVIGAGSVVTHAVPPGEVWAGNPARKVPDAS